MLNKFIAFFGGFLVSSILDTTISEFQEWNIVGASLIVASLELLNNIFYTVQKRKNMFSFKLIALNYFKLGLIYGLIVDALKLGS